MAYRKSIMIIGLLIIVLIMLPTAAFSAYTNATPYDTTISNYATVTGANFQAQSDYTNIKVLKIKGGVWAADTDIASASAGAYYSNMSKLTNLGNDEFTFRIVVTNYATGGIANGPWNWQVFTNLNGVWGLMGSGSGEDSVGYITLLRNQVVEVKFKVQVDPSAQNSSYEEWELAAFPTNTAQNTTNYQGDNGEWYGGPNGRGLGDIIDGAVVWYGTGGVDDNAWRITVSGPQITIVKKITFIEVLTNGWVPTGGAVPGATIRYEVYVSNSATAGPANDVVIRDYIPPETTYVPNSVSNYGASGFGSYVSSSTVYCTNHQSPALSAGEVVRLVFRVIVK